LTRDRPGGSLVPHRHTTGGTDVNAKRWTLCLIRGHRWARTPYAGNDDGDQFFLRCTSCRYENHNAAMPGRPSGPI
jgi:hypothetical protein